MTVVASTYVRQENDLYETEPWAVEALLRHFPDVKGWRIWEPSAGNHKIADVLEKQGAFALRSDICSYEKNHDFIYDFLSDTVHDEFDVTQAIITNPPFGKGNRDAVKYAEIALKRCDGWVALLLTAKFSFGKTRKHLFADNPRFYAKIELLDRISWFDGQTGTEDFAWYVWGPANRKFAYPKMFWEGKQ